MKRHFQTAAATVQQPAGRADVVDQSPYLTALEAAGYLKFRTVKAFYEWLRRHPDFPKSRRGSHTLLFEKRICDAYLRGELRLRHTRDLRAVTR